MTAPPADPALKCVEHHPWTPVPHHVQPPDTLDAFTLRLKDVDPDEGAAVERAGAMTFHLTGCSGDFERHQYQTAVAEAMAAQVRDRGAIGMPGGRARPASFLFLLGDIAYKDDDATDPVGRDQDLLYAQQFYEPYTPYERPIFAIAGNHDSKHADDPAQSPLSHFLSTFCAADGASRRARAEGHRTMTQPYLYWRLTTPVAYIIGLYSNVANGGILDDPRQPDRRPQYEWLVRQLQDIRRRNERHVPRKAVLLAVHYPPYSGATNFAQRGDPRLGRMKASPGLPGDPATVAIERAVPIARVLEQAFRDGGLIPDAVFSAHAHLYQRVVSRYGDGREVPYLIVGGGGHYPVEKMGETCAGQGGSVGSCPFDVVLPPGLQLLPGQRVQVAAYDDRSFGFLRVTIAARTLYGEFFTADAQTLALGDWFSLDLDTHRITDRLAGPLPRPP